MNKILVIEDDESFRTVMASALKRGGYETLEAADGDAGLKLAFGQLPDLVISDVEMPRLNGNAVLKALRSHPATATIPFIMMTGRPDKTSMRMGMFLGADDYLPKPFPLSDLMAAIAGRLRRQQQLRELMEAKLAQLHANLKTSVPPELLTPLTSILGFADLLQEDCESLQPAEISKIAADLAQAGQRLLRLTNNYMLFLDLEFIRQDPARMQSLRHDRTIATRDLMGGLVRLRAEKAFRSADVTLDLAEGPVAMGEDLFRKLVEELVDNAFKFSIPGTRVLVTANHTSKGFSLAVCDQGRGMTPEQIAQIGACVQFDRPRYEQQGLGLGLAIARRLVELHSGTFAIQSQVTTGTTVTVRLPQGP
jgi:two-component system sensor histidine kinase/response regulator